jgi:hypothetical protein
MAARCAGGERCLSILSHGVLPNPLEIHGWHTDLELELAVFARM